MLAASLLPARLRNLIVNAKQIWRITFWLEDRRVAHEALVGGKNAVRVVRVEELAHVCVNGVMARIAQGNEVSRRVVALVERNAFASSINVVDMQARGRSTFPAGPSVSVEDRFFVAAEHGALFGNLAPLAALQMRFVDLIGSVQFKSVLAGRAANLRASFQDEWLSARRARVGIANDSEALRPSPCFNAGFVSFGMGERLTVKANALRGARGPVGRAATRASSWFEIHAKNLAFGALNFKVSADTFSRLPDATLQAKATVGASYAANDNGIRYAFADNDNLPVHWRVAL